MLGQTNTNETEIATEAVDNINQKEKRYDNLSIIISIQIVQEIDWTKKRNLAEVHKKVASSLTIDEAEERLFLLITDANEEIGNLLEKQKILERES